MTLNEEWKNVIKNEKNFYIYGAGVVAKRLLALAEELGMGYKICGFIVSSLKGNCMQIQGKKVLELNEYIDKTIPVLVSLSRPYHPEVFDALKNAGVNNVIEAHKYYNLELKNKHIEENKLIQDDNIDALNEIEKEVRYELIRNYQKYSQSFGKNHFYQSFPRLHIIGDRPTDKRLEIYGIYDLITPQSTILDIGSNCGFIDMTLAERVKRITGIEYNEKLVECSINVASKLKIENVKFICDDFNKWFSNNEEKYDVVFSFAVHVWLNITPKKYAQNIDFILNNDGYFVFESQTLNSDILYDEFCNEFVNKGLKLVKKAYIKDDGKTKREFCVFKK